MSNRSWWSRAGNAVKGAAVGGASLAEVALAPQMGPALTQQPVAPPPGTAGIVQVVKHDKESVREIAEAADQYYQLASTQDILAEQRKQRSLEAQGTVPAGRPAKERSAKPTREQSRKQTRSRG